MRMPRSFGRIRNFAAPPPMPVRVGISIVVCGSERSGYECVFGPGVDEEVMVDDSGRVKLFLKWTLRLI
jgi:hypothetical protein